MCVCMYGYLCGLGFRFRVEVLDEYFKWLCVCVCVCLTDGGGQIRDRSCDRCGLTASVICAQIGAAIGVG